jgi:transcription antitermination factor NusG
VCWCARAILLESVATLNGVCGTIQIIYCEPLSDFDGEIVDVNPDQQKLKVLVDIFERQVPVELGFDQVKKID